jgi:DNA-directed RNA polymerase specialized sigma24 family protein
MAGKSPYPDSMRESALELYQAGKNTREIAAELEINQTTASRWVRRIARRTGPPRRPDVTDERLWRLRYEQKLSYDKIAAAVGMARTPVRKRLDRIAADAYEASP